MTDLAKIADARQASYSDGELLAIGQEAYHSQTPGFRFPSGGASREPAMMASQESGASSASQFIHDDLHAAVSAALEAPDSTRRLRSLRMSVGSSPEAVAGLRNSIIDDFRRLALSTVEGDAAQNARPAADGAASWLKAHRGAVANILTTDQFGGLEAISRAVKDRAQSFPERVRSAVFDRLATNSILSALLTPDLAEAPILRPVKRALGLATGRPNEAAMLRLLEVMADSKVAAALMKRATAGNVKMAEPILERIVRGPVVNQAVGKDE